VPQFVLQEGARSHSASGEPDDDIAPIELPLNVQLAALPEKTAVRRFVAPGKLLVWLERGGGFGSILAVWRLAPQLQVVSPVANAEAGVCRSCQARRTRKSGCWRARTSRYVDHFGNTWTGTASSKGALFSALRRAITSSERKTSHLPITPEGIFQL